MTPQKPASWPERVTSKELATIWKVSTARISQFVSQGKLKRGDDGKFNLQEALAFRSQAISDQHVNVFFQSYGNKHGSYPQKILEHINPEDVSDEEALDLTPKAVERPQDVMKAALERRGSLDLIKQREGEMKLAAMQRRADREAGVYIERNDVFRRCQEAGAEITGMLRTLEYDIPAVFADPATRKDVRRAIQQTVDRCLFTLKRKFGALGIELVDDEV
jgi:hypothetical protein